MLKPIKNYHFLVFLAACLFPQVFGYVNEWPILEFHEMIRMLHVGACSIFFVLFCFFCFFCLMSEVGREEC